MEDEHHVIFDCPRYTDVRNEHIQLIQNHKTISEILNPGFIHMREVANLLHGIERRYKELGLC